MEIPSDDRCTGPINERASLGIVSFFEEFYSESDLVKFLETYDPEDLANRPSLHCLNDCRGHGLEASLDLQLSISIAKDCDIQFWFEPGLSPKTGQFESHNEPFLKWAQRVLQATRADADSPPQVYSLSYSDWEGSVDTKYAEACEDAFKQMALLGITIVVASGDAGVEGAQALPHQAWPDHPGDCSIIEKFMPTFPSTSHWVTSVGATTNQYAPEAAELSGGGFSAIFKRPYWQRDSVDQYLKDLKVNEDGDDDVWWDVKNRFEEGGRGFPDIAAAGENIMMVDSGKVRVVSGTSASTPVFASMITLINDKRLKLNLPAAGFLNPLLYKHPEIFQDIKTGRNPGCSSAGFAAAKGWDPVTGLGVPMYDKLLKVFVPSAGTVSAGHTAHHHATRPVQ